VRRSTRTRYAALLLAAGFVAVLGWLGSSALVTWRLTHRARGPFEEPLPAWAASAPGRIEEVRLDTRDGERLGAWFLPPSGAVGARAPARAAVVVLHGNSGSRSSMAEIAAWLSDQGLAVLAPSLRAHGDSSGDANDLGFGAREDVRACVDFLEKREPGVPIVVFGSSLGAAAAIYAAPELGPRIAGYALEAPYRDVRSATRHRLRIYLPPVLDRIAYWGLDLWSRAMLAPDVDALAPIDYLAAIPATTPIVFLCGTDDRSAPLAEVEEMRARCGGRATLAAFAGATHRELADADPGRFRTVLFDLVASATAR